MKNLLLAVVAVFCVMLLFGCNKQEQPKHFKTDEMFSALPQAITTESLLLSDYDIHSLPVGSTITFNKIDKVMINTIGAHLTSTGYAFFYRVSPKEVRRNKPMDIYHQSPCFTVEAGDVVIYVDLRENDEQWACVTIDPNNQLRLVVHLRSLDFVN